MAQAKKTASSKSKKARAGGEEPRGGDARICAAALEIAAERGWGGVTLEGVAKGTRMPLASVKKRAGTREALIPLIVEDMTRQALATVGSGSGNPHDDLFDLMMARFDALQQHREGVLAIADEARRDRGVAVALGRAVLMGMSKMINAAKLELPSHPVLAAGLAGVYGWAFFAWRRDETRDLAKTMAAVDKALKLVGKGLTLAGGGFSA